MRSRCALAAVALAALVVAPVDVGAGAGEHTCSGPGTAEIPATIVGTEGDDVLIGTEGHDVIAGLGGDDRIEGVDGNDDLCGDAGNDLILAGPQQSGLYGGAGDDVLRGSPESDTLWGGGGDDRLVGRGGISDDFYGDPGNDRIVGTGKDELNFRYAPRSVAVDLAAGVVTGWGRDRVSGLKRIFGSTHDDLLVGSSADEHLDGWSGSDVLRGRGGADRLEAREGSVLRGGSGADSFDGGPLGLKLHGGRGKDAVGYPGGVRVSLRAGAATLLADERERDRLESIENARSSGISILIGDHGPNVLVPNGGRVRGLGGDDTLGSGTDSFAAVRIRGGAGDDTVMGSLGDDKLWGGSGDDEVFGDFGMLDLDGFPFFGDDLLDGGAGTDHLDGDDGVDECINGETVVECELP